MPEENKSSNQSGEIGDYKPGEILIDSLCETYFKEMLDRGSETLSEASQLIEALDLSRPAAQVSTVKTSSLQKNRKESRGG